MVRARRREAQRRVIAPRLIALTDRSVASASETLACFERLARAAQPGSVMLQLRDRELSARERLAFGRELRRLATRAGQLFQVNDRLDLARLLEADAVHLAGGSVSAADARAFLDAPCFVTRAGHAPGALAEAGVDGWLLSPLFAPRKGREALGLEVLREMHTPAHSAAGSAGRALVYALGGVSAQNAADCVAAGAAGVAVIGAVLAGGPPGPLLEALGIAR
jgi:thiamine-phosphate pyrophosphorylase